MPKLRFPSNIVPRALVVCGRRTTLRLEPDLWAALDEMTVRERAPSLSRLVSGIVEDGHGSMGSATSAVRAVIVPYYRAAADEAAAMALLPLRVRLCLLLSPRVPMANQHLVSGRFLLGRRTSARAVHSCGEERLTRYARHTARVWPHQHIHAMLRYEGIGRFSRLRAHEQRCVPVREGNCGESSRVSGAPRPEAAPSGPH